MSSGKPVPHTLLLLNGYTLRAIFIGLGRRHLPSKPPFTFQFLCSELQITVVFTWIWRHFIAVLEVLPLNRLDMTRLGPACRILPHHSTTKKKGGTPLNHVQHCNTATLEGPRPKAISPCFSFPLSPYKQAKMKEFFPSTFINLYTPSGFSSFVFLGRRFWGIWSLKSFSNSHFLLYLAYQFFSATTSC